MTTELTILAWTLVLALVQIMLAAQLRTQETGLQYNMSARDGDAPPHRTPAARTVELVRDPAPIRGRGPDRACRR